MSVVASVLQKQLFDNALSSYRQGSAFEAAVDFIRVASLGGDLAAQTQKYLEEIALELGEKIRADSSILQRQQMIDLYGDVMQWIATLRDRAPNSRFKFWPPKLRNFRGPVQIQVEISDSITATDDDGGGNAGGNAGDDQKGHDDVQREDSTAAATTVQWIPHMDLIPEGSLTPDMSFQVSVYLDRLSARPREASEGVPLPDGAQVEVHLLVTRHFSIQGPDVQSLITEAQKERAQVPPFVLKTKSREELSNEHDVAGITALFLYKGRPSGKVSREVEISGANTGVHQSMITAGSVEIRDAQAADLCISIVTAPANDGRQFYCTVQTSLLEEYKGGVSQAWNLPDVTEKLVSSFMSRFTTKGTGQLISELQGAGIKLFEAAPEIFKEVFWKLADRCEDFSSISIVSEEPFVPWELMVPRRIGEKPREPLGVQFSVGRWIPRDCISASQDIRLTDSYVIAPMYEPRLQLKFSTVERDFVVKNFQGEWIDPADFDNLQKKLGFEGKSLLHFVCHGKDDPSGLQTIYLSNKDELDSVGLLGMGVDDTFRNKRPLVFLNACEVGRLAPSLVGVGGFARSFIELGAGAVIAPLWSVKDDVAHQVAVEFYEQVKKYPSKPFATILKEIRAKAYQPDTAEDTYAAYCFYGDPAAHNS